MGSGDQGQRRTGGLLRRAFRSALYVCVVFILTAAGVSVTATDWRTASREPVGLAPDPAFVREAVVQVYGALAVGAKGIFGVHTWIAVKRSGAPEFTVHEVIGYRLRRDGTTVVSRVRPPDSRWFGAEPDLLKDVRGPGVDALIDRIFRGRATRKIPSVEPPVPVGQPPDSDSDEGSSAPEDVDAPEADAKSAPSPAAPGLPAPPPPVTPGCREH